MVVWLAVVGDGVVSSGWCGWQWLVVVWLAVVGDGVVGSGWWWCG